MLFPNQESSSLIPFFSFFFNPPFACLVHLPGFIHSCFLSFTDVEYKSWKHFLIALNKIRLFSPFWEFYASLDKFPSSSFCLLFFFILISPFFRLTISLSHDLGPRSLSYVLLKQWTMAHYDLLSLWHSKV